MRGIIESELGQVFLGEPQGLLHISVNIGLADVPSHNKPVHLLWEGLGCHFVSSKLILQDSHPLSAFLNVGWIVACWQEESGAAHTFNQLLLIFAKHPTDRE